MDDKKEKPSIEIADTLKETQLAIEKRLDLHQNIIYAVLIVVGVGFVSMVIATLAIFLGQDNYFSERQERLIELLETQDDGKVEDILLPQIDGKN
ncbi:MAG: hypothetical protein AAB337_03275 [Patescibacteria group bacterium]